MSLYLQPSDTDCTVVRRQSHVDHRNYVLLYHHHRLNTLDEAVLELTGGSGGLNPPVVDADPPSCWFKFVAVSFVVNGKLESRVSVRATSVIAVECKELRASSPRCHCSCRSDLLFTGIVLKCISFSC